MSFNFGWTPLIRQAIGKYFASAVQGARADSAVQPAAVGVSVQPYNSNLESLSNAPFLLAPGRLTLSSTEPRAIGDITDAATLYYLPDIGDRIQLFNGTDWDVHPLSNGISLNLTGLPGSTVFDIFVYWTGSAAALEAVAWANDAIRSVSRVRQNGVLCKSSDRTKRYLGTVYTSGAGRLENSESKRFVWNYYNQIPLIAQKSDPTGAWTYNSSTFRPLNNKLSNRIEIVTGEPVSLNVELFATVTLDGSTVIGFNSITDGSLAQVFGNPVSVDNFSNTVCSLTHTKPAGYAFYQALEFAGAPSSFSNNTLKTLLWA